jgi:ribonuclease D
LADVQNQLRMPTLVDTDAGLAEVARALETERVYFLDTEFESVRAGTTLSVVQISAGREIHLIDGLKVRRLEPLGRVVGRPGVTWVLHAGLQDVELLRRGFELRDLPRLFDTQIAWGLMSPESSVSLAYLQYRLLGLRYMKPHQADDWMRRPLPRSQLEYAASDIEHLPELYRALAARADEMGRMQAVVDACREMLTPVEDEPTPALNLASFRNAWQLDPPAQAALRFLIDWQNRELERDARGALGTKTLLAIASRLPKKAADIARIKGVPEWWARRHAERVVDGIRRAVETASGADFVPIEPATYATWEEIKLDGWLAFARSQVSARANVAPELGFNGRVMRSMRLAIATEGRNEAAASALTGWRRVLLEAPYLEFCRGLQALAV